MSPAAMNHTSGLFKTIQIGTESLTHTSTGAIHLSTTSNIFAEFGPMKLKICRHTTSGLVLLVTYYRLVFFFYVKKRLKNRLCHDDSESVVGPLKFDKNYTHDDLEVNYTVASGMQGDIVHVIFLASICQFQKGRCE